MKNYFTFAGKTSLEFGIYINGQGTFGSPAHSYNVVNVPGRNGDLLFDNQRFENINLKYSAFIAENYSANMKSFRNFMMSKNTYQRLEDTYHPDEFRMAVYKDAISPDVWFDNTFGSFDVVFFCKPQRFLKTGETSTDYTASSFSVTNPTLFQAKPLMRVYGSGAGTVTIGGAVITLSNIDEYVDLDFETMNAYKGSTSKNSNVSLSTLDYPTLKPGVNNITTSGNITKVTITPRWYII